MHYRFKHRALTLVETPRPLHHGRNADSWKRIVVVSNRLPFNVSYDSKRKPSILPSSGGLVTAMTPLMRRGITGKWIGWPGTGNTDEEGGLEEALRTQAGEQFDIAPVALTEQEIQDYYGGFANEVIAPAFVEDPFMIDRAKAHTCWRTYQDVQQKFARAIYADLRDSDIVWVHDYHLLGVGNALRTLRTEQPVGFFLHMPFPSVSALHEIPQRLEILRQMLAYDVIGFQTGAFAINFLKAVRNYLPAVHISRNSSGAWHIRYRDRVTRIGHFPISIDANEFERQLYAQDTQRYVRNLSNALAKKSMGKMLIFNTGRSDYSKGFLEELQAFDLMLGKHPELVDRVILCQLVVPSRGTIEAHRMYRDKIAALSREINAKHKRRVVRQIHTHMDRARYLAHLHVADVLSIPTLADGMNLVSKEGAIVGNPSMTLLLGEKAGAAEELGSYALLIDPTKVDMFAQTLYRALTMPETERRWRKRELKSIVTRNDIVDWWNKQESLFQEAWEWR